MKFILTLTAKDYIKARYLSMRPRPFLRYVGLGMIGLYALCIGWQFIDWISSRRIPPSFWQLTGIGLYFALIFFVWIPRRTRKLFKQQKILQQPTDIEFTDTHFMATSPLGTFKMPWVDFHKWKRNREMVLIYQSDALMHMIPFRCLSSPSDIDVLCDILRKNLGAEKS